MGAAPANDVDQRRSDEVGRVTSRLVTFRLVTFRLVTFRLVTSRLGISRLGTFRLDHEQFVEDVRYCAGRRTGQRVADSRCLSDNLRGGQQRRQVSGNAIHHRF